MGFVIIFTAYLATQNVASQAMRDFGFENIGFYSVASVYGSYSITSLFCSPLVKKLGAKKSLCLASMCFTIWIVTFILPAMSYDRKDEEIVPWYLKKPFINTMLILSSIICGAGNSIIWVAHGSYISECATDLNKGLFNGFFWIIL
jgi:MFS family permease